MTKIERNEIIEKVKTLDPEEAKKLLIYLLKEMDEDIDYRYAQEEEFRDLQEFEIATYFTKQGDVQGYRFCNAKGWLRRI